MAARDEAGTSGEYRRLLGVPKRAIVDLLSSERYRDEVVRALGGIGRGDVAPSTTDLASLSQAVLVRVAQACPSITDERAKALYEEYLYRGMKSLYLYELVAGQEEPAGLDELSRLGDVIAAMLQEAAHEDMVAIALSIRQNEVMHPGGDAMFEASYAYLGQVRRTSPETEYPEVVDDLRRGFMWVSLEHGWLAVCARDEAISDFLALAVGHCVRLQARRLPVSKSVLKLVQPDESMRRIGLMDPRTRTRRRWTGARLSRDETAMSEVLRRRDADEQSTAGYNETLPDGSEFALGYSGVVGRVYFSRDLTVTQMREWGPRKITDLVAAITTMRSTQPGGLAKDVTGQVLTHMRRETREAIGDIAAAVLACKSTGNPEIGLGLDTVELLGKLGNHVDAAFLVHCPECGQLSGPQCASCHSQEFAVEHGSVKCTQCGRPLKPGEIHCAEDYEHVIRVAQPADAVTLTPASNLLGALTRIGDAVGASLHALSDFFTIRGRTLYYLPAGGQSLYTIDGVSELAALLVRPIPEPDIGGILPHLGDFREACDHPTIEMCATCVQTRHGGPCYQRLFGLFDPEYTPRPHSGSEFSDYSKWVTLDSGPAQMVVAMKPGRPAGGPVTRRSRKGQDIHTQVVSYLTDTRMHLVGICLPQRLDAGFVATLVGQAAYYGKKLLVIQDRDLARIVYSVMIRHKLSLDSI